MENQVIHLVNNTDSQTNFKFVDFDYSKDVLFIMYSDENRLVRADYNPHSRGYLTSTLSLEKENHAEITIDWVLHKVFTIIVEIYNYHYKQYDLEQFDYKGDNVDVISEVGSSYTKLLRMDCHNRLLFYVEENELKSYNLLNGAIQRYTNIWGHTLFTFAVDSKNKTIYLVTSDDRFKYYILSLDYKNETTPTTTIYRGPETSAVVAIDAFDGELLWINDVDNNNYIVYKCILAPICLQNRISVIAERNEPIFSLKIYGPRIQTLSLCQIKNCSHTCIVTGEKQAECTCPHNMKLGKDKVTCRGKTHVIIPSNTTYVGCFNVRNLSSPTYVEHFLTWDQCVDVCDNRRSEYVGIRADGRNSSFNFCYCGLTTENQTQSGSDSCFPCYDDNAMHCGGNETISIYKLRDSVPLLVLLATSNSVKLLNVDRNVTTVLVNSSVTVTSLDFYSSGDDIFFTSYDGLYTTYYSPFTESYVRPKNIPYGCKNVAVAVDWVYKRLYCIQESYLLSFEFSGVKINTTHLGSAKHLVLDANRRLAFYICSAKVCSINLVSNEIVKYDFVKHMDFSYGIALNCEQQQIYTFGIENGVTPFLVTFGYKNRKLRVVFKGPELTKPFTLAAFNDIIFWGNNDNKMDTLYRCKLNRTCQPFDVEKIYSSSEALYDAKIFNYKLQSFSIEDLCKNHNCSDGCQITETGLNCYCPAEMELAENEKTCHVKPVDIELSTKVTEQAETSHDKVQSIQTNLLVTTQYQIHFSSSPELSTIIENHVSLPYTNNTFEQTDTPDSKVKNDYLRGLVLGFGLLVLLIIVVFVCVKRKRSSLDMSESYGQTSELELTKI